MLLKWSSATNSVDVISLLLNADFSTYHNVYLCQIMFSAIFFAPNLASIAKDQFEQNLSFSFFYMQNSWCTNEFYGMVTKQEARAFLNKHFLKYWQQTWQICFKFNFWFYNAYKK